VGEAIRLMPMLSADPTSWLCAALNDWEYPISREAILLADLFDLDHKVAAGPKKHPKPHPVRPWRKKKQERYGNTGGRTREQIVELLDRARRGQL